MSEWKILHNPRCSKSRQTLALLEENGIDPVIIKYLEGDLKFADLKLIVKSLKLPAEKLVRIKEEAFKNEPFDLTDDTVVLEKLAANPKLIERPVVIRGKNAVIGRPPENVLKLL